MTRHACLSLRGWGLEHLSSLHKKLFSWSSGTSSAWVCSEGSGIKETETANLQVVKVAVATLTLVTVQQWLGAVGPRRHALGLWSRALESGSTCRQRVAVPLSPWICFLSCLFPTSCVSLTTSFSKRTLKCVLGSWGIQLGPSEASHLLTCKQLHFPSRVTEFLPPWDQYLQNQVSGMKMQLQACA